MKIISILLLLAGLAIGPGYWLYAKFFTGQQAAMLDLTRDGAGHWRSLPFDMRADMAPAGLILWAQTNAPPAADEGAERQGRYLATLHRDAEAAKPLGLTLRSKHGAEPNPSFREHLVFMPKVTPGRYWLEIVPAGENGLSLSGARLEVRSQLVEPDPRLVTGGMLILAVGLLGLAIL